MDKPNKDATEDKAFSQYKEGLLRVENHKAIHRARLRELADAEANPCLLVKFFRWLKSL